MNQQSSKSNLFSLFALVVAILALGISVAGLLRNDAPKIPEPSPQKAAIVENAEKSINSPPERIRKLLQEILATQLMASEAAHISFDRGLKSSEDVLMVDRAMLNTKLALCASKEERAKVYAEMITKLATYEELAIAREAAGQVTKLDVFLAKNERLLVQVRMEREALSLPPD